MKDKYKMVGKKIPEFSLPSSRGDHVNIYQFYGKNNVAVFLLRGLMDPFCQQQIFRLGKDADDFAKLNCEIFPITADRYENARRLELRYAKEKFPIFFDNERKVTKILNQEVKIFRLGRLPAVLLLDKNAVIRWAYYGDTLMDVPPNKIILEVIQNL